MSGPHQGRLGCPYPGGLRTGGGANVAARFGPGQRACCRNDSGGNAKIDCDARLGRNSPSRGRGFTENPAIDGHFFRGGRRSLATGSLAPLDLQLTLGIRPESLPGADAPAPLVATARASSDAIQSPWSGDTQVTEWAARAETASSQVVAPEMPAQAASSDASAATAAASAAETGTDWRSWTVLFSAVALGSGIYLTRPPGGAAQRAGRDKALGPTATLRLPPRHGKALSNSAACQARPGGPLVQ
jgi:hypothetical protein